MKKKHHKATIHQWVDIGDDHYHFQVNTPTYFGDVMDDFFEVVVFKNGVKVDKDKFLYLHDVIEHVIEDMIERYEDLS